MSSSLWCLFKTPVDNVDLYPTWMLIIHDRQDSISPRKNHQPTGEVAATEHWSSLVEILVVWWAPIQLLHGCLSPKKYGILGFNPSPFQNIPDLRAIFPWYTYHYLFIVASYPCRLIGYVGFYRWHGCGPPAVSSEKSDWASGEFAMETHLE